MRRLWNSFAGRLVAAVLLLVLVPTALLGVYLTSQARSAARDSAVAQIASASAELADGIDAYIVGKRDLAHYAASSKEVRDYVRAPGDLAARETLIDWLQKGPFRSDDVAAVLLLNSQGTCVAATNPALVGQSYGNRPYYQQAIGGRDAVSDWSIGAVSGEPGIFLASPVRGAFDEMAGVLIIQLKTTPIEALIKQASAVGTPAAIVNDAGIVLTAYDKSFQYHSVDDLSTADREHIDSTLQFANEPLPSLRLPTLRQDLAKVTPGETLISREYQLGGVPRVSALTGLASQPWALAVVATLSDIEASTAPVTLIVGFVFLLIVLYAVFATLYVGRSLVRPLRELADSSRQLADGDWDTQVPVRGSDEIAELATAFNSMAVEIRGNTERLEAEVARRTADLEDANRAVTHLSITDDLTGCYNRRFLDRQLKRETDRAERYGRYLSVIMCDLDLFKSINDQFGHAAGDAVLRTLGAHFNATRRATDWVARFGGEEFVIVLPETTGADALSIADRARAGIEVLAIAEVDPAITFTASFGVASFRHGRGETPQTLIDRSDAALYLAKAGGRNQVQTEDAEEPVV